MKFFKKEKIYIEKFRVVYLSREGRAEIPIEEISEIRYQWDLGVGFMHYLVMKSSSSDIIIEGNAEGINDLLGKLSSCLKNFPEINNLESLVEDDLAWDNIHLWGST